MTKLHDIACLITLKLTNDLGPLTQDDIDRANHCLRWALNDRLFEQGFLPPDITADWGITTLPAPSPEPGSPTPASEEDDPAAGSPFVLDCANSDHENFYIDVTGLGSVQIIARPDGLAVNIYPLDARDTPVATASARATLLASAEPRLAALEQLAARIKYYGDGLRWFARRDGKRPNAIAAAFEDFEAAFGPVRETSHEDMMKLNAQRPWI